MAGAFTTQIALEGEQEKTGVRPPSYTDRILSFSLDDKKDFLRKVPLSRLHVYLYLYIYVYTYVYLRTHLTYTCMHVSACVLRPFFSAVSSPCPDPWLPPPPPPPRAHTTCATR